MYATVGPGSGAGALEDSGAYRWLVRSLRLAWLSCSAAVAAMLLALVLRSSELAAVFRLGLLVTAAAVAGSLALFVLLIARGSRYPATRPLPPGRRADALVANLLADLLDPAYR